MRSSYQEIDSGTDAQGIRWRVGKDCGALVIETGPVLNLDGAERAKYAAAVAKAVRDVS